MQECRGRAVRGEGDEGRFLRKVSWRWVLKGLDLEQRHPWPLSKAVSIRGK